MSQELVKAERAALIQAVKALYIPLSLFIACVISAGGMYMVLYTEEKNPGYAFLTVAFLIIVSAFVALIRFQNNYRAQGLVGREEAYEPGEVSNTEEDADCAQTGETVAGEAPAANQSVKEPAKESEKAAAAVR